MKLTFTMPYLLLSFFHSGDIFKGSEFSRARLSGVDDRELGLGHRFESITHLTRNGVNPSA